METEPYSIPIYFEDGQVDLHGRIHMATNTIFLPMHEIEPKFQLEYGTEHRSEWLALMSISPELITAIPGF